MNRTQAIEAIRETGIWLERAGVADCVTLILGGAVAAMVTAGLPATRVTHDCDVLASEPQARWQIVRQAAMQIALRRGFPENWLNQDAGIYAYLLPSGWRERCEHVGQFGPLTALVISRRDLMAMKLMSAAIRPHDLEDMMSMHPTPADIAFLHEHLDRLDMESLSGEPHTTQRAILHHLEQSNEQC